MKLVLMLTVGLAALAGAGGASAGLAPDALDEADWLTLASAFSAPAAAVLGALGGFLGARLGRGRAPSAEAPDLPLSMPPLAMMPERPADVEAQALRDYLVETFGERMRSVEGAKTFFERLVGEIAALRKGAVAPAAMPAPAVPNPLSLLPAALAIAGRALEQARVGLDADPELKALEREVRLDNILRELRLLRDTALAGALDAEALLDQAWLQELLRAEAICHAYYPVMGPWHELQFGLAVATTGVRVALHQAGVRLHYVRLLTPRRAGEGDLAYDDRLGLQRLPMARTVVGDLRRADAEPPVIDCLRFGCSFTDERAPLPAQLVIYNVSEWH